MSRLDVTYFVSGHDHDGYCSGETAGDHNEMSETEIVSWDVKKRIVNGVDVVYLQNCYNIKLTFTNEEFNFLICRLDISELDFQVEGCTSGGSGYCDGFYRDYTATKVEYIEQ